MKSIFVLVAILVSCSFAKAGDGPYEPQCKAQALAAIAKTAKVPVRYVSFYDASLIGDGVDALETISAQVKGSQGLWFVTAVYDDCAIFQAPKHLNY